MKKINKIQDDAQSLQMAVSDSCGSLTITCEDNMELMKRYPDKYFDLAIVDPEYGIGDKFKGGSSGSVNFNEIVEKGWDKKIPSKEYFNELFRVSKNQIIWGGNYFCEHLPSGKGWIYWDKQMGENNFSSGEFAYQSMQTKSSSFSEPSMRVSGTRIHPTQKPIYLYDWIFKNYATEGMKILDTHLGSGSSRISANKAKLNFVGCEIDEEYFNKSCKRYDDFVSQVRLF